MNEILSNLGKIYGAPFQIFVGNFSFTNLYAFILLLMFSLFWWRFFWRSRSIRSNINEGIEIFKGISPESSNKQIGEIRQKLEGNESLSDAWREFKGTLIIDQEYDKVVCPSDAETFFHDDRLISLNRRFYNALPGIFTGFGILGTFLGLIFGIQGFDSSNAEQLRQGVQGLLAGMAIAFSTSVWGITLSLLFTAVEKVGINKLEKYVSDLQDEINRVFSQATEEYYLDKLCDDSQQQTAALKSFSTDLADAVKISMSEVVTKDLAPVMLELTGAIKELGKFKEESATDAIEKIVDEFRESLTSETNTEFKQLSQALDETASVISKIPQEFNSFMDKLGQSSVTHQKELVESLEESRIKDQARDEQLQNSLNDLLGKMGTLAQQQTDHLQQVTDTMRDGLAESLEDAKTQEQSRNEELQSNLTKFLDRMESLTQQQTGHLQQVADTMQNQLSSVIKTFGNNIQKQSDAVTENMKLLLKQTQTWAQELENRFNKLSDQSEIEISKVQEVLAKAESIIESSGQVVDNANQSAIKLNDTIQSLDETVRDLNDFANKNQQTYAAYENTTQMFVSHAEQYREAIQSTLEDMKSTVTNTQKAWKAYEKKFGDIRKDIEGVFTGLQRQVQDYKKTVDDGLEGYISVTRSSLDDYLKNVDDQLGKSTNMLANAIETLSDGIDDLNDAMDKIRRGRS